MNPDRLAALPVQRSAIEAARRRIAPYIHRTPILTCAGLDDLTEATLVFKCENLQKTGAFKARGAINAVFSLDDAAARNGVTTHSSGNHAAALARAARLRRIPAHVVMPANALPNKVEAVKGYGAKLVLCEPTLQAREAAADAIQRETGAHLIPPYDDERIIAGQGTAIFEFLEQVADLDLLIAPVGGGGLLAGALVAAKSTIPQLQVLAAEPSRCDDAYRSWKCGRIVQPERTDTVADGLRTALGERNFAIINALVDDILRVEEATILRATRLLIERAKTVVEPSGAVGLAAVLDHPALFRDRRVGIILSGGNLHLPAAALAP